MVYEARPDVSAERQATRFPWFLFRERFFPTSIMVLTAFCFGLVLPDHGLIIAGSAFVVMLGLVGLKQPGLYLIALLTIPPLIAPEFKIDIGLSITADRVLLLAFIVAVLITRGRELSAIRPADLPLWRFFLLLSIMFALTLTFSENPLETLFENIYIHFTGFLVFYATLIGARSTEWCERLDRALLAVAIVLALTGLAETVRGSYFFASEIEHFRGGLLRAQASLGNPIPYGVFLSLVFPIALFQLTGQRSLFQRLSCLSAAVIIGGGVVVSFSRQAYLSVVLTLLMFTLWGTLLRRIWEFRLVAVSIFIVVGLIIAMLAIQSDLIGQVFLSGDAADNVASRLHMSLVALAMLYEHPFTGIGLGNFRYRAYDYSFFRLTKMPVDLHGEAPIVDNTYLTVLAETGLIGGTIFMSMLFVILTHVVNAVKSDYTLRRPLVSTTEMTVILLLFFNGFMVDVFEYKELTWLFWVMSARVFMREEIDSRQEK